VGSASLRIDRAKGGIPRRAPIPGKLGLGVNIFSFLPFWNWNFKGGGNTGLENSTIFCTIWENSIVVAEKIIKY